MNKKKHLDQLTKNLASRRKILSYLDYMDMHSDNMIAQCWIDCPQLCDLFLSFLFSTILIFFVLINLVCLSVQANQICLPRNPVLEGYIRSGFRPMRYFCVAVIDNAKIDQVKRLKLVFQDARSTIFWSYIVQLAIIVGEWFKSVDIFLHFSLILFGEVNGHLRYGFI